MRALLALLALVLASGCALAPRMRAPLDLPKGRGIEAGVAVSGLMDATLTPGAGASAWITAVLSEQMDFVLTASSLARVDSDGTYQGHHVDAALGLRLRQPILHDTWLALEGMVQYEQRDFDANQLTPGGLRPHLTFIGRGPVAQQFPGVPVWVYAAPTTAISIPLYANPIVPFFPVYEMPLGLVWRPAEDWALYVEGGLYSTLGGGYGAVGLAAIF
jgi:hypothetical protein